MPTTTNPPACSIVGETIAGLSHKLTALQCASVTLAADLEHARSVIGRIVDAVEYGKTFERKLAIDEAKRLLEKAGG